MPRRLAGPKLETEMAKSIDELQEQLVENISQLASKATTSGSATGVAAYGAAAKDLAEALAWLRAPAQPH